jgi:two-component system, chemotaxis family, protein-glutamate methylesterase/glutaminase
MRRTGKQECKQTCLANKNPRSLVEFPVTSPCKATCDILVTAAQRRDRVTHNTKRRTRTTGSVRSMIRILVVDDSPSTRQTIVELINKAEDMQVVGEGATGLDAVRLNYSLQPHVIAMDCHMPLMDGLQATRVIMQENPTRVVILQEPTQVYDAEWSAQITAVGALDSCTKPVDEAGGELLLKTLRAMSQVGVVRLTRRAGDVPEEILNLPGMIRRPEIVLIVSSTGGPPALETILSMLPPDFPLPIAVVQHISDEFVDSMTNWLNDVTPFVIKMAEAGERPQPGHIYIAPIGVHLRIAFNGRFSLEQDTENYRHIPSGDVLLESAAQVYGPSAIGIVLTGMGIDGAAGLTKLRENGGHTIVQDEATSVVFGMPKAAIEMGGSEYIMPLDSIAPLLNRLARKEPQ